MATIFFVLEIEAKIRIEDFSAVRALLTACGATLIGRYEQTNIFFDTAQRSLSAGDQGLRLRRQRDVATGTDQFILTFKGPTRPGLLKTREERELVVASAQDAVALLESLGYTQIFQFEKHREVWQHGDCEIALDDLPTLGRFVEVEGPNETAIKTHLASLGLTDQPLIRESYVALLMK